VAGVTRRFRQVDVFGQDPCTGNPVAVVLDAQGLDDDTMRRFSVWTNLSECTFVLPPTGPDADYRVRIFCLDVELPFAGHPTLGTARAWLDAGGRPLRDGVVIQECGAGLVPVRLDGDRLAFAAPPRTRSGPVEPDLLTEVMAVLGVSSEQVVDAEWLDNGPGWVGVLLDSAGTVLELRPDASPPRGRGDTHWDVGVIGPTGDPEEPWEVRAFFGPGPALREDPVTGSLNAAAAQWLLGTGRARAPYVARQGTALGRRGRVHVSECDGEIWVGGDTHVAVAGSADVA
jgi:PhzF family phenazine biosynthesis protein